MASKIKKESPTKKSPTSLINLINAGKNVSEKINKIESVANEGSLIREDNEIKKENVEIEAPKEELKEMDDNPAYKDKVRKKPLNATKTSFSDLLVKTEIKDIEIIRIPRELHKELKTISNVTGISLSQLSANIISSVLNQYREEIIEVKKQALGL